MKKFRLLSSLLAALMVLSMFTAMPVGAAQTDMEPFFCDFESFPLVDGTGSTASSDYFTAAGFKVTNAKNAVIDSDEAYGHTLGQIKNNSFKLEKMLDNPITSGKVRIGFSYKMTTGGFSQIGCFTSDSATTATLMMNLGSAGLVLVGPPNGRTMVASSNNGTWYYIDIVVDLDNHKWTIYVDGVEKDSYPKNGEADLSSTLTAFYGLQFWNNAERTNTDARIDNLVMSHETASQTTAKVVDAKLSDNDDGTKSINLAFSESPEALGVDDVTIEKCGDSTAAVEVDSVDVNANRAVLNFASDASFEPGCEYVITFSDEAKTVYGKTIAGEAYVYIPGEAGSDEAAEVKNFDNMTIAEERTTNAAGTTTYTAKRYIPQASEYENIFQYVSHSATTYDVARVKHDDLTFAEGESGTDYALGATVAADYWIGWPIDGDTGIEVYEFDCYFNPANTASTSVYVQIGTGGAGKSGEFFKLLRSSSWQHIRVEYNTSTDILTAYVDGTKTGNAISAPNDFQKLLRLNQPASTTSLQGVVLAVDNYTSYVVRTPLFVESVRYVDATGKVTGANIISPATTQIDISFSEEIDSDVAYGIELTADGEPVEIDLDNVIVTDNVISLPVPGMLPGGAQIELYLNSDIIESSAGNMLSADKVYRTKTAEGTFEIYGLSLTVNGNEVESNGTTGSEGDTVVVTADVINTAGMSKKLTLIYAFYNDCELVDIGMEEVIIEKDDYVKPIETEPFTTKANVRYDTVKAFIWDSMATGTSQTVAVSYPVE